MAFGLLLLFVGLQWVGLHKIQLCPFRLVTGHPCPGCGLTHAALCLARGDIVGSLRAHALLLPTLFTIAFAFNILRINMLQHFFRHPAWLGGLAAAFVVYYGVRMALWFPGEPPMHVDSANLMELVHDIPFMVK